MGSIGIISAGVVISFFGFILYIGTIIFNFVFSRTGSNFLYREFYECGFKATTDNSPLLELHFFLISLIFLIYEMEIILFVPLLLNCGGETITALCLTWFCLLTLGLSYLYEWERYALTFSF